MLWRKELGGDVERGACPFGKALLRRTGARVRELRQP